MEDFIGGVIIVFVGNVVLCKDCLWWEFVKLGEEDGEFVFVFFV